MTIAEHKEAISRLTEENRLRCEAIGWIAAELDTEPEGSIVQVGRLRERLHVLAKGVELDADAVVWALDTDGRYWGEPLAVEAPTRTRPTPTEGGPIEHGAYANTIARSARTSFEMNEATRMYSDIVDLAAELAPTIVALERSVVLGYRWKADVNAAIREELGLEDRLSQAAPGS